PRRSAGTTSGTAATPLHQPRKRSRLGFSGLGLLLRHCWDIVAVISGLLRKRRRVPVAHAFRARVPGQARTHGLGSEESARRRAGACLRLAWALVPLSPPPALAFGPPDFAQQVGGGQADQYHTVDRRDHLEGQVPILLPCAAGQLLELVRRLDEAGVW